MIQGIDNRQYAIYEYKSIKLVSYKMLENLGGVAFWASAFYAKNESTYGHNFVHLLKFLSKIVIIQSAFS